MFGTIRVASNALVCRRPYRIIELMKRRAFGLRGSRMFLLLHELKSVASIARRLKMSGKTVRKYRDADQLPHQIERAERSYRTREDPLTEF